MRVNCCLFSLPIRRQGLAAAAGEVAMEEEGEEEQEATGSLKFCGLSVSSSVLQCVAVCCSVLQYDAMWPIGEFISVAVCSVLQCLAVCSSV